MDVDEFKVHYKKFWVEGIFYYGWKLRYKSFLPNPCITHTNMQKKFVRARSSNIIISL